MNRIPLKIIPFPKEAAADVILTGGNIITMDSVKPLAQAVAIRDGRFLKVGKDQEAKAFAGTRTRKIDLKGKTVTPGFIDSHQHLSQVGTDLLQMYCHSVVC